MRQWPNRGNRERVDLRVATSVVPLDVIKLRGVVERRLIPVQVTHPLVQKRVSGADIPNVALEVLDVDGVETNERHVSRTYN